MSTPTMAVVATPVAPLTNNHVMMAARLQAKAEAQQAAEVVARLPRKVASTPRKVMEFLKLPQLWDGIRKGAGAAGSYVAAKATPVAGFISRIGLIPSATVVLTGDKGQAVVRWVAKSAWSILSWVARKAGRLIDTTLRIFGRPGKWVADRLLNGTTKTLTVAAKPIAGAYNLTAPLVSSKSGHVKLVNRLSRLWVTHKIVRMFVKNFWAALAIEVFVLPAAAGFAQWGARKAVVTASDFKQGFVDGRTQAKAEAAVDAHIAYNAAQNAKQTIHEQVRPMTVSDSLGSLGEKIEGLGARVDAVIEQQKAEAAAMAPVHTMSDTALVGLFMASSNPVIKENVAEEIHRRGAMQVDSQDMAAATSPTAPASPSTASNGADGSDSTEGEASTETVADQPGQPVETVEALAAQLEAEGKIGQVIVPADASREDMLDGAQRAADKLGEDVVAVLPTGESVVVEPTGTVVERVIEAEGPELSEEVPAGSRGTERALQHAGVGKRKPNRRK